MLIKKPSEKLKSLNYEQNNACGHKYKYSEDMLIIALRKASEDFEVP